MRYDEKSGLLEIGCPELIALSLCRLASETGYDRTDFSPVPMTEGELDAAVKALREAEKSTDAAQKAGTRVSQSDESGESGAKNEDAPAAPIAAALLSPGARSPRRLWLSFEEGGVRFSLSGVAEGASEEEGCLALGRVLPCHPAHPPREVERRLRGEAFLLAHLWLSARQDGGSVRVVTLCAGQNQEPVCREERISRSDAARFFDRVRPSLSTVGADEVDRVLHRLPTLRELKFPYADVRDGQRDMMQTWYSTLRRHGRLFACAPTGTGKTAAALYPAVRAMGEGACRRIFYLTPKGTTARVAADTVLRFCDTGARLRGLMLTAKERACPEGLLCRTHTGTCRRSRAGGAREEEAARALLARGFGVIGEADIRAVADDFGVCPYELSLRYSLFCDVIICDYNYLFDPRVALRRFFDRTGPNAILVDEAHDLVERAREIASGQLELSFIHSLCGLAHEAGAELGAAADRLREVFLHTLSALEGERTWEDREGVTHALLAQKSPPDAVFAAADAFCCAAAPVIADRRVPYALRCDLRDRYYTLADFAARSDMYDERYETFLMRAGDALTLRVLCLDPGAFIDSRLSLGAGALLFSATLAPLDYYRTVLGGDAASRELSVPSPFESERLCVAVMDKISTRYAHRTDSATEVAEAIYAMVSGRMGNYFVFCPSYSYMEVILRAFRTAHPEVAVAAQPRTADRRTRDAFLDRFVPEPDRTLVGFCVTGGAFAEGIDLVGSRLIGAAVVGVSLPQPSPERDAMTAYYDEIYERGKEFAYIYPGMNRVLQAAGRVIRSEEDCGVLLLIDDRFNQPLYRRMIPQHWRGLKFVGDAAALSHTVGRFWAEIDGR